MKHRSGARLLFAITIAVTTLAISCSYPHQENSMPTNTAGERLVRSQNINKPQTPLKEPAANTESYTNYGVNWMTETAADLFSTFAIDVDPASYTIARRKLTEGQLPPAAAVRVEEFLNYFKYHYAQPTDAQPFSINVDGAPSPFNQQRYLLRVGLQGERSEEHTSELQSH